MNRNFKAKTPVMKRYLNLIQTLYTVNHNSGIDILRVVLMQQVFMIMTLPRFLSQQLLNSQLSLTLVLTLIES